MVTERKKKSKPLEKQVQAAIAKLLRRYGYSVDIITKGLYGSNGISDIIACKDGRYVAIEVKRDPSIKPSPLQAEWLKDKRAHGAIAFCVGSVVEVIEKLGIEIN